MDAYRRVLAAPGAASVLLLGFLARIPFSTLGLLLTLHCVLGLDRSYLEAGLIVTASTLGTAISSPWRGRLVDRHGLRRAIAPPIIIQPLCLVAAAFSPYPVLVALAFIGGLFAIPVWTIVRTSLSVIVPAALRRSAFALDAVLTEIVFMAGPAGITILAMSLDTRTALVIVAASVVVAGVGLAIANPPTRSDRIMLPTKLPTGLAASESAALVQGDGYAEARFAEDLTTGQIPALTAEDLAAHDEVVREGAGESAARSARRALLSWGGIAVLAATGVGNATIMATDLSIVAIMETAGQAGLIGLVMAAWCAGSLIGGLVYGMMTRAVDALWVLLLLGALTVPVAFASDLGLLLVAVVLAGLALAPLITVTGEAIAQLVAEEHRGEAMGWHGTSMTVGAAVGSPVFGAVIDQAGPSVGVGAAAALAVIVACAGIGGRKVRRVRLRRRYAAVDVG